MPDYRMVCTQMVLEEVVVMVWGAKDEDEARQAFMDGTCGIAWDVESARFIEFVEPVGVHEIEEEE